MKFEIEKIVLYRKSKPDRKVYDFESGMMNAVIGNSTTGKSTFLKIVDYVLGGDSCMVPERVTRVCGWVGVLFRCGGERTFIARLLPSGDKAAEDLFSVVSRPLTAEFNIPDRLNPNAKREDVNRRLDAIVATHIGDGVANESESLKFRDLLTLCFQDTETIVSETRLFGSSHAGRSAVSRLAKRLLLLLGIKSDELNKCIASRREAEAEYKAIKDARKKAQRLFVSWKDRLTGDLQDAKKNGLLPPDAVVPENPADMRVLVEQVIAKFNSGEAPQVSSESMEKDIVRLNDLQARADALAFEIDSLQYRKVQIEDIQRTVEECRKEGLLARGRLQITRFLKQVFDPETGDMFPIAGHTNAETVKSEYASLCRALDDFDGSVDDRTSLEDCRKSFKGELDRIYEERERKIAEFNAAGREIRILAEANRAAEARISTQRNLYMLCGRIASAQQLLSSLVDEGITIEEQQAKREEIENLKRREVDLANDLAAAKEKALVDISTGVKKHISTMNLSLVLKSMTPRLGEDLREITLESAGGEVTRLRRMGSLANHLAFHSALTCAMQEYFASVQASPVPGFVMYDQPKRSREESWMLNRAIARSSVEAGWQAIVLAEGGRDDLFAPDYAEGIHIVADFSGDRDGIVPREWLEG